MTVLVYDSDGIPRCQLPVNDQPCNGFLFLTQDNHNLVCEKFHGKLIPVDIAQAALIRQAYKRRDDPSKAELNRRWKEALPVAIKIGTFTRTAYSRDKAADVKERVAIYEIDETLYETVFSAKQDIVAIGLQVVSCVVSKSGIKTAKLLEPISLTEQQVAKIQKKHKGSTV